jgi:cytochrome c
MKSALTFVAALVVAIIVSAAAVADEGDAGAGKVVFKKCAACHDATAEKNKVGPYLVGVVGRTAGSVDGFKYSKSMVEAGEGGLVWDEENLAAYLRKPKDVIPKGTMAFPGLKEDEDIENVIEYLKADPKP